MRNLFRPLVLAWAIALFGGLCWGVLEGHGALPAVAGRMCSSLLLVAIGALAWVRSDGRSRYPMLITLGMILGTLGDFFNAGLFGPQLTTLAAMAAFGAGHVFYIAAAAGRLAPLPVAKVRKTAPIHIWFLLGALGWWLVVFESSPGAELAPLVWPALGYTLLLSATAGVGTALGLAEGRTRRFGFGAVLFLVSDMVLGVEIFRGSFPQDTLAVWLPYGCGQMLIVTSAVSLLADRAEVGHA